MKKIIGYMWIGILFLVSLIILILAGYSVLNVKTILGEDYSLFHLLGFILLGLLLLGCLASIGYLLLQMIIGQTFPDKYKKIFKEEYED